MNTIQKIFSILIIGVAAILCFLIPEIWRSGMAIPILAGSYSFILLLSIFARRRALCEGLILSAIALPISEMLWSAEEPEGWIWKHIDYYVKTDKLVFSFAGWAGYVIVCLIIPFVIMAIANIVRKYRADKQKVLAASE